MDNNIFNLYMEVIAAAKHGRYMYGNGAMWYIVDYTGHKVMINTINGTRELIPFYDGVAHTSLQTAENLIEFLANADCAQDYLREMPYNSAVEMVADAVKDNELLFTNGGQWYINHGGTVVMVELSSSINGNARLYVKNMHSAWCYRRFNGEYTRHNASDETKKFLGIR